LGSPAHLQITRERDSWVLGIGFISFIGSIGYIGFIGFDRLVRFERFDRLRRLLRDVYRSYLFILVVRLTAEFMLDADDTD
jgi:hypothetical protein